jgi:hypothetical protein
LLLYFNMFKIQITTSYGLLSTPYPHHQEVHLIPVTLPIYKHHCLHNHSFRDISPRKTSQKIYTTLYIQTSNEYRCLIL